MDTIRILIVTQYFYPENFRVNDLAMELRRRHHQVTVLTGIPNYPHGRFFAGYGWFKKTRETIDGVEVIRVPLLARGRGGKFRLALNYLSFALFASLLGPWRCRGHFDVVFVHEPSPITVGIPAIVMKAVKRTPLFFWVLDLWPESLSATGAVRSPRVLRWVEGLVRFIYRHCDRVLVQSRGFIARVAAQGALESQIRYFPNWAEPYYRPLTPAPAEMAALPPGFRLMYAGNIGAAQDFATVLAAAERLKDMADLRWVIIGDGRMADWVAREVAQRGLTRQVCLLGRHAAEAMPAFFAAADAMLVTLAHDPIFELTVPAKVQAYLACGRPIVAALDGEGARVVEESGAGFACGAGDAAGLARVVRRMHAVSAAERQEMGRRALQYSREHFDRDSLFDRLETWMREAIEPKPTSTQLRKL